MRKPRPTSVALLANSLALLLLPLFEMLAISLPEYKEYIPDNLYRSVGVVLVTFNIVCHLLAHKSINNNDKRK